MTKSGMTARQDGIPPPKISDGKDTEVVLRHTMFMSALEQELPNAAILVLLRPLVEDLVERL